mmetsp:Transcript_75696/g.210240  ORF Transcript_75696/g.210240 Transcript_75696/m.210240 type:complete len:209 (+) Transcript_75696:980-1606(+)
MSRRGGRRGGGALLPQRGALPEERAEGGERGKGEREKVRQEEIEGFAGPRGRSGKSKPDFLRRPTARELPTASDTGLRAGHQVGYGACRAPRRRYRGARGRGAFEFRGASRQLATRCCSSSWPQRRGIEGVPQPFHVAHVRDRCGWRKLQVSRRAPRRRARELQRFRRLWLRAVASQGAPLPALVEAFRGTAAYRRPRCLGGSARSRM